MDKPIITYHVLKDDIFTKQSSYYAGTYTGDNEIVVRVRIWNNYRGTTAVEDLSDFNLSLHFLTKEDNALLPYIKIETTNGELNHIEEEDAWIWMFDKPPVLKGSANTGSEENKSNYTSIVIRFKPGRGVYLKDHDLKSLVLEIVEF